MTTLTEIRQRYPEYDDLSDDELTQRLHAQFYADMPYDDFARRIRAMPRQVARDTRPSDYSLAQGASAAWAHGGTIGAGDEIAGLFGGATEGVQSFFDPSRGERPRARAPATPMTAQDIARIPLQFDPATGQAQGSAALQIARMPRPQAEAVLAGPPVVGPDARPPQRDYTLGERFQAAAEGARRGFDETQDRFNADVEQYRAEQPEAAFGTELAGAIFSPANWLRLGRVGYGLPIIGGGGFREAARVGALYSGAYGVATGEDWDPSNPEGRINPGRLLGHVGIGAALGPAFHALGVGVGATGELGLNVGTRFGLSPDGRAVRFIARAIGRQQATEDDLVARGVTLRRRMIDDIRRRTGQSPTAADRRRINDELARRGYTRAAARTLVQSGQAPFMRAEDMAARGAYVRRRNRGTRQDPSPTAIMNYELLGEPGVSMANATANARGPGRDIAARAYARRTNGSDGGDTPYESAQARSAAGGALDDANPGTVSDRMISSSRRALGPEQPRTPQTWDEYTEALQTIRASQARENYTRALAADPDPGAVAQELGPLIQAMPQQARQAAARSGINQLEFEIGRLQTQLAQTSDDAARQALETQIARARAGAAQLIEIEAGRAVQGNIWALDYFQRGLQQFESGLARGSPEASSVAGARNLYNETLRRLAPQWGEAHALYGASMRLERYAEMGRNILRSPEALDDALNVLRGNLTVGERDALVVGVLRALDAKLAQGDTRFVAQVIRRRDWQQALRQAMGKEAYESWYYTARLELYMRRLENAVMSGSKTARTQEDISDLVQETELGFLREAVESGNVQGTLLRRLLNVWDRWAQGGIRNPEVNRALARRLFQTATKGNQQALVDEINALPWYARVNNLGESTGRIAGRVGAVGAPIYRAGTEDRLDRARRRMPPEDLTFDLEGVS